MIKKFLYIAQEPIKTALFEETILNLKISAKIKYFDEYSGLIEADSLLYEALDSQLRNICSALKNTITFLAAHCDSPYMINLLKYGSKFFRNQIVFPSDIIMKQLSFGDYSSYKELKSMFSNLDFELLETAGAYLRCNLDAVHAANHLGIHRNTFNYRLNRFTQLTSLDVRDYHNALLLELYFQLVA